VSASTCEVEGKVSHCAFNSIIRFSLNPPSSKSLSKSSSSSSSRAASSSESGSERSGFLEWIEEFLRERESLARGVRIDSNIGDLRGSIRHSKGVSWWLWESWWMCWEKEMKPLLPPYHSLDQLWNRLDNLLRQLGRLTASKSRLARTFHRSLLSFVSRFSLLDCHLRSPTTPWWLPSRNYGYWIIGL